MQCEHPSVSMNDLKTLPAQQVAEKDFSYKVNFPSNQLISVAAVLMFAF